VANGVSVELTASEARVIGCLIEKSIVTPDQYPLTLNALSNACNQKSGRNPVMALQQGEVQRTVRELVDKHLVRSDENFKSRVEKYSHRFCNTQFSEYQFDAPQLAIVCLLLLRGAQTPGEFRSRSGRLHKFETNSDVIESLAKLMARENEPLVVKLPRTPGRKDSEYMHLFSGDIDVEDFVQAAQSAQVEEGRQFPARAELLERIERLEADVAELQSVISPAKPDKQF
jgi:uncharacterized protein YceH (UPF0502 family)